MSIEFLKCHRISIPWQNMSDVRFYKWLMQQKVPVLLSGQLYIVAIVTLDIFHTSQTMTNNRQYHWGIVEAWLDRKQCTCKLSAETLMLEEGKSNLFPPSTVKTEHARGGGVVEVEEGGSIFALLCPLLRQPGASCKHVGLLSGLRLAPGRELWPRPRVTQLPLSDSDGRAGETTSECCSRFQSEGRMRRGSVRGWGEGVRWWLAERFLGRLLQCQPRQRVRARVGRHRRASGEIDRSGVGGAEGGGTVSYCSESNCSGKKGWGWRLIEARRRRGGNLSFV